MRRYIIILLCLIGVQVYAFEYVMLGAQTTPVANMSSVNDIEYMSSGSKYSSDVDEIDTSTPDDAPVARRARKSAPGVDDGSYNPNNPQFSPIGDGAMAMMVMAMALAGVVYLRRRKAMFGQSTIVKN